MTISNKEELKNEIYKLKRHNIPNPFIMHSEKETINLNSVIDLIDRLDETKDKEKFDFTHVYDYFEKCKNEGNPVIGRHWLEKVAKLYDRELVKIKPDTVATVIYDYMKAAQRFKEILGMEVEEVEE